MKQDALAKWLKFIIVGVGICGLITYTVIMPRFAEYLVRQNSMLEKNVLPWLILIWISAVPCYAVLVLGWKIADNIRMDRSFSYENAGYLKWVSYLSMGDAVFVFLANIVFLLLDMSVEAVMLVTCIIVFAGILKNPYPLLKKSNIYVHPSYVESQGISVLEALSLHIPCVVTESLGPKEYLVNEENALLVERGSKALTNAILRLYYDNNLYHTIQRNSYCPEEFLPENVMRIIVKIL